MRAGQLRKQIQIQQRTLTPDGEGGVNQTWGGFLTSWGMIEPLGGTERAQYAQLFPTLSARITMRFHPGISTRMRVVQLVGGDYYGSQFYGAGFYGGSTVHTWEILDVQDQEERHRELILMCEELGVLVA